MYARGREITSSFSFQSRMAREEREEPIYMLHGERDQLFLKDLCNTIHDLPTMCAAMACAPGLLNIPLFSVRISPYRLGWHSKEGVEINLHYSADEDLDSHFDVQLTTLPHELRHGYQTAKGCMEVLNDPRILAHLEDHILFERMVEADATAFSLAVMYELIIFQKNGEPMHRARELHGGPVDAYMNAVGADQNAHWNGVAAHAAFEAYFYGDNYYRLKKYDLNICDDFLKAAYENKISNYYADIPCPDRYDVISDYVRPLSRMPYLLDGCVRERKAYQPTVSDAVMRHLSPEVRDCIEESKHVLAPG